MFAILVVKKEACSRVGYKNVVFLCGKGGVSLKKIVFYSVIISHCISLNACCKFPCMSYVNWEECCLLAT